MKKHFKDMSTEEIINIIMNNNDLKNKEGELYYQQLMDEQVENAELMLGKEYHKYIDVRDNYNSFFMVLKDWHKFIDNLDKDYLCVEGIDLYDKIMKKYDEYGNMVVYDEEDEDRLNNLEEELENDCKKLLDICEGQLHEYEDYTEEDFKERLRFRIEEYKEELEDYYIIDDDTSKVYQDISYTKTYC